MGSGSVMKNEKPESNYKPDSNNKRGYLKGDFEFFHLKDKKSMEFEYHYHDFNKIIVFLSGNVTYLVEGKSYKLRPWDILLVSSREIHKPLIDPAGVYERIIIWVNPEFLEKHSSPDCRLLSCFELAMSKNHNLLRLNTEFLRDVKQTLTQLEAACKSNEFGYRILRNSLLIQLVVHINRLYSGYGENVGMKDVEYDKSISEVLKYINENLEKDLSIDALASRFFMSRYHLMHKFKEQTGYSIHNYILQKRLIMANAMIKSGMPAVETSIRCGFGDYSSFVRAFKKMFGLSPKKHYKNLLELQKSYEGGDHFRN